MPPLVTEDSEDYSDADGQHSTDATDDVEEDDPQSNIDLAEGAEPPPKSRVIAAADSTTSTSKRLSPKTGNSNETGLVAELPHSAEEDESDEDDDEEEQLDQQNENGERDTAMQDADSEEDAEGESEEDNDEDAEGEEDEDAGAMDLDEEVKSGDESESSDEAGDSQGSDTSEEATEAADADLCTFCNQTEDDDPSDEFEPYLKCTNCNNHAHQQCARDNKAIKEDQDPAAWRCLSCAEKSTNSESPKDVLARARNSAPRLVRDLLPVSRGVQKPNSHSIFAQPLISDGEDGGRSLRKRKSPTQEPPTSEKRRRRVTPHAPATPANCPTDDSKIEDERAVAHSTRRASQKSMPTARILQHRPFDKAPPHKFILAFRLEQDKIEKVLSKPPRPGKRRDRRRPPKIPPPPIFQPPVPKFPALPTNHLIFPAVFTERDNELNAKPYGGILSDQEADTSRSLPQLKDREIFEIARKEAEEERRRTSAAAEAEINGEITAIAKPSRTVSGPPSKIKCIQFGKYVIDTFYAAPYPEEYSHESRLFICEFCLKYLPSEFVAYRHKLKCPAKHPPGDEIYRDGSISIWEVDGRKKTEYCQCLCLMAKMFLGSKTLYYDVEPFLFYILTEYDELGYHFVGYFSKEKRPASQNNVSCILVMPIHQRKGYATFLIDFSYLLTRIEGKDGSPEKPLSDMGLTAYRSYWDLTISRHLLDMELKPFSTKSLMAKTGMTADDVIHSLERLYAFTRDPATKTYAVRYDKKLYESIVHDFDSKKHRRLKPDNLVWTPYIMGRSDQAALDGQPMHAVAPREEDIEMDDVGESQATNSAFEKDETAIDTEALSPRSKSRSSKTSRRQSDHAKSPVKEDPTLINDYGVVAPGPPSTEALTAAAVSTEAIQAQIKVNGLVNGDIDTDHIAEPNEELLTGYALAYRNLEIPPSRFQIDPPIPPSMLRNRSTKKRSHGSAFDKKTANDSADSPAPTAPVRSSPRNAASTNGSVNGASPEKVDTPVRRSVRKSGLANVEVASLDGTNDSASEADKDDVDDELEAKPEGEEEAESSSGEEESEDEEEESADDEDEGEEDAEVDDDGEDSEEEEDDDDADAEVDVPGDDESSEDQDAEGEEEEDDEDD